MTGDETVQLVAGMLMLVLVGSSLAARRLPLTDTLRMVAAWVLIFAVVLVGYSYRFELNGVVQRVGGDLLGDRGQAVGSSFRVPMAQDGHFWVRARVNGEDLRFLVDSGATTIALSASAAQAAGISVDASGSAVTINTANGAVAARRARISELVIGPITVRDLAAVMAPAFGDTNVLGMNFLSSLRSWRVEGGALILEPHTPTS